MVVEARPRATPIPVTLYRVVFYTSLITGLHGILFTLTTMLVLGLRVDPVVLALTFTVPTLVYMHDRLVDGGASNARARWIAAHRRALTAFAIAVGGLSALFLALRPRTLVALAAVLCFALSYTVRWLPGKTSPRQLPGFKTPYVAGIWTLLVVALPLVAARAAWDRRAALLATVIFLIMSTIVTVNDIYDIDDDRRSGTRSLAVLLGEGKTRLLCCLFSAVGIGAAVGLGSAGLASVCGYTAFYALYVETRRGRDYPPAVVMFRVICVMMPLLVVTLG